MKANKLMIAALFMGALAMASCSKKESEDPIVPVNPGTNTDEAPEVDKPADGYVTIVINIPAGSECNGIAVKGTIIGEDGTWTGADQYLAADGSVADAAGAAKFEKIEGNWWKTTIKLGAGYAATDEAGNDVTNYLAGKICLIYKGDGSWDGQASDWEFLDDSNIQYSKSNDGNLQVNGTQGVLYIKVNAWNKSECVTITYVDVTFTMKPQIPVTDDGVVYIVGDAFEQSWVPDAYPMTKDGDSWKVTLKANVGGEYKYVVNGTWDNDQMAAPEEGQTCSKGAPNIKLEGTSVNDEVYGFLNFGVSEKCE